MECISSELLLHRSKHRIKKLGEVFTPEMCVEGMLSLLSKGRKNFWSDEDIIFFEPCCGHGNIVIQIVERRLSAIYSKAIKNKIKNPAHYTVASVINTLWAIDIDKKNIKQCRARVLAAVLDFLRDKLNLINYKSVICQDKNFVAHILCAIDFQIHQNETLSAISEQKSSCKNACKTLEGSRWYKNGNYRQLSLHKSWAKYFRDNNSNKIALIEYKKAINCLNKIISSKCKANQYFDFTDELISVD
jgi:hypothetical protein